MSRWLQSVNMLLEQLDDRVENVVEERTMLMEEEQGTAAGGTAINDILAKRGLDAESHEDGWEDDAIEDTELDQTEKNETVEAGNSAELEPGTAAGDVESVDMTAKQTSTEALTEIDTNESMLHPSQAPPPPPPPPPPLPLDGGEAVETEDTPLNVRDPSPTPETSTVPSDINASKTKPELGTGQLEPMNGNDNNNGNEAGMEEDFNEKVEGMGVNSDDPKEAAGTTKPDTTEESPLVRLESAPSTSGSFKSANQAKPPAPPPPPPPPSHSKKAVLSPPRSTPVNASVRSQKEKALATEAKEAQKEARTLRRHVVSLNAQLEAAEAELQAQRKELEQVGNRMEKDRKRSKDEKEAAQKRHAQEISSQSTLHEKKLKEQKSLFEDQLATLRERLAIVENQRKQEGGDWNKEMQQAIEREQEMRGRVDLLEDEKAVLVSQISTLQAQQAALGSRLESLTQAADNAMGRERDAEDRLDSALTQHARQITQRQTREAELERTIQELNAALVLSQSGRRSSSGAFEPTDESSSDLESSLKARLEALQADLQTANSNLTLERERSAALHQQLREMSRETKSEVSAAHTKQLQHDRKMADMSLTISKLEASLREAREETSSQSRARDAAKSRDNELSDQVKMLSEEVLKLRDKVASHSSESLALKNRLRSANERATKAEEELAIVNSTASQSNGTNDMYDAMERAGGPTSGNGFSRRRKGGGAGIGIGGPPQSGSIRTAMKLTRGQGNERTEQIGQVVDAVDAFAVSTGKYLRRNPLARAGFIFYLLLIHLWTFLVLFMHAHRFEPSNIADYDNKMNIPHGPHAIVQQGNVKMTLEEIKAQGDNEKAQKDSAGLAGEAAAAEAVSEKVDTEPLN